MIKECTRKRKVQAKCRLLDMNRRTKRQGNIEEERMVKDEVERRMSQKNKECGIIREV
jgi:hypothetical protein